MTSVKVTLIQQFGAYRKGRSGDEVNPWIATTRVARTMKTLTMVSGDLGDRDFGTANS